MQEAPAENRNARPFLRGVSRQRFGGPVLTLLSGTTAATALSLLSLPLLTRLYSPEDFGILHYVAALIGLLTAVSSLHYDDAVLLPEDDGDAANVAALAFFVTLSVTVLCATLLLWRESVAAFLGMPDVQPWLFLVPPALFAVRLARLGEAWLARAKRFRAISAGQLGNAGVMNGARLAAALPAVPASPAGLIGGFLAGQAVSALLYAWLIGRQGANLFRRACRGRRIAAMAARYKRFALFTTPSALLHTVIARLPFLLIPFYFQESGAAVLGFLGQAVNVVAVPLGLIGGAVSQVLIVYAAEANRRGSLETVVDEAHERLVMCGLFPALISMVAGPDLFAFALGEPWREAGAYLAYLAPWLFLSAVAAPLTRTFDVLERQRTDLLTTLAMFALLTTALVLGGMSGDIYRMLLFLGIGGALARILHLGVLLRLAGVPLRTAVRPYLRFGGISLPFLALVYAATMAGEAWITVAAVCFAGIAYFLTLRASGCFNRMPRT